ncbi:carboxypeptidase-like regulatory domain-containing protein [Algibacter pectinivorans]|uniref:CarboxypepD_reg-like domain-containing protein n=1 Tax=Algibacter pectinivorans TaxID=870482 RepID=A0A1I1RU42_9FLAO|nr:carboxypeptidase-like regulatory domain-containing protein [Algibacter pectinivorans]SFD37775.1 CarboxypepD_reg-like domain-containing protein [Algibacter pectinivorans]
MQLKITLIILLAGLNAISQNITAQLIDKNTKTPIPYATIKTGNNSGTISNDEGYFTISSKSQNLTISCMGYQSKNLTLQDIKALNYTIALHEALNQLGEVYISNKNPNADSIINKVKQQLNTNYSNNLYKHHIFKRDTDNVDFTNLDFEIEKASHVKKGNLESANASFKILSKTIKESDIVNFRDFKGTFYTLNQDSTKLVVQKATSLLDAKNDFSLEQIQEKAQNIVLKYLDTTKTYKLKSGLFKIEDSLSLKNGDQEEKHKQEYNIATLNKSTRSLVKHAQFFEDSFLNTLLDFNLYEYNYIDAVFNSNELTHIISFTPKKGKAKYTGQLYISDNTYAITQMHYKYYKNRHGQKVNLKFVLGVKYIENVSEGTLLFEKDSNNIYLPKYIKRTYGSYFYVKRDVKFIENSNQKSKVNFSFKIEGNNSNKEELLFTSHSKLNLEEFKSITQDSVVPYQQLNKFEKTLWKNEQIIEPTLEMKAFKAE